MTYNDSASLWLTVSHPGNASSQFNGSSYTITDEASYVISKYMLPVICGFGMIGILLTVVVLSRKDMCTSTNCHLTALAIADFLFLLLLATRFIESHLSIEATERYRMYYYDYAAILMQVFLMASIWLTVMLAVERYIAICRPFLAAKLCTVTKARLTITLIYILAFIIRIPMLAVNQFVSFVDPVTNTTVRYTVKASFSQGRAYTLFYPWIVNGILLSVVPFLLLLFLNGCLIREVRRSTRYLQQSSVPSRSAQREEFQISVMLISVIIVFFVCQAPYVVYTAVNSISPLRVTSLSLLFQNLTVFLLVLKSSFNFVIYCWFSHKFLTTLKRTMCSYSSCPQYAANANNQQFDVYQNVNRQKHNSHGTGL